MNRALLTRRDLPLRAPQEPEQHPIPQDCSDLAKSATVIGSAKKMRSSWGSVQLHSFQKSFFSGRRRKNPGSCWLLKEGWVEKKGEPNPSKAPETNGYLPQPHNKNLLSPSDSLGFSHFALSSAFCLPLKAAIRPILRFAQKLGESPPTRCQMAFPKTPNRRSVRSSARHIAVDPAVVHGAPVTSEVSSGPLFLASDPANGTRSESNSCKTPLKWSTQMTLKPRIRMRAMED